MTHFLFNFHEFQRFYIEYFEEIGIFSDEFRRFLISSELFKCIKFSGHSQLLKCKECSYFAGNGESDELYGLSQNGIFTNNRTALRSYSTVMLRSYNTAMLQCWILIGW